MQTKNAISIKRRNFGRNNAKALFIFCLSFFLLGVAAFISNWKNGLCSISIIAILYLVLKNSYPKISILFFSTIALIIGLSFLFNLNFIEILLTTVGLAFSFLLKPTYKDSMEDNEFEVFFLNNKELRYLEPNNFRYKGYAFNPKAYKKTIPTNSIQAFTFERKYVMISAGNEIIRPRELTIENIQEINLFVKDNFPYLLENEQIFKRNLKIENKLFINKFLLSSPFIIFSIAIYFFADNGKDKALTNIFIICMFISLFIICIVIKRK